MIRKAEKKDLESVMPIYEEARKRMRASGNMTQWINGYPSLSLITEDIKNGDFYIVTEDEEIIGAFSFIIGEEPTYQMIEGNWINNNPYGTIHRIVSSGKKKGILKECLDYCFTKIDNIRIDTHKDNKIMLEAVRKYGFSECGTIWVSDGSPRIAFQRKIMG